MSVTTIHKLSLLFCLLTSASALDSEYRDTGSKAALLLAVEPKDPKCFTESLRDLTCFWDESLPPEGLLNHTFHYRYESEDSRVCNLTVQTLSNNRSRFLCEFPEAILFAQLDVTVIINDVIVHHRSLSADQVLLLDPPMNLSVRQTGKPGQLHMKWLPPSLKYMDDSIIYEVGFSTVGSELRKTEVIKGGRTDCVLMKLKPLTQYVVSVRAKPDGVTYNGYWSAWSEPVTAETPTDLDPLILALSLILLLIITVLSITVFLSHRRFLLKKMWPLIPSPESTFGGLFTVHRGNFQEWLGHNNVYPWWSPSFFYFEEMVVSLEILSEFKPSVLPPLPPKAGHQFCLEEGGEEEGGEGGEEEGGSLPFPQLHKGQTGLETQTGPLHQWLLPSRGPPESKDAYVILNFTPGDPGVPDPDVPEEEAPLQTLFATSESSVRSGISSDSERQSAVERTSSGSSFDYAVYDPSGDLVFPSKDQSYAYLRVADSGISVDYSPMGSGSSALTSHNGIGIYTNLYKNDIGHHLGQLPHSSGAVCSGY
ncbi:erythropoietin receptor [Acipenser oxyrinchus oxyrinchus]|uniref:Erythropoietin receptor n=1 Tax=Acipenser oxyrinchus oxyrinchus TaxID=40147 RepID=A0AAD8CLN7_ACIOX|nr:erythropoietin receptor [Acipenser oxyrinchus oxyrinchus]